MPSPNPSRDAEGEQKARPHVVAIDYGSKHSIVRNLVAAGARVTIVPAGASFDEVMVHPVAGSSESDPADRSPAREATLQLLNQAAARR